MKKLSWILVLVLITSVFTSFTAMAESGVQVTATPTSSKVLINGKEISLEAYKINDNNFFKLRDIAVAINGTEKQFDISWDSEKNAINLLPGKKYTTAGEELTVSKKPVSKDVNAIPTNSKIYMNGSEVSFTAYTIDGNNYFKLRDIGKAFNFGVNWDSKANVIGVDTKSEYVEDQPQLAKDEKKPVKKLTFDEIFKNTERAVNEAGYTLSNESDVLTGTTLSYLAIKTDNIRMIGMVKVAGYGNYAGYENEIAELSLYGKDFVNLGVNWLQSMGVPVDPGFHDVVEQYLKEIRDRLNKDNDNPDLSGINHTFTFGEYEVDLNTNKMGWLYFDLYYKE